ncbi:GNAT family N-acetyltransferase [Oceanispirochaeta crateris]|uniref:GNAT family N-acetyltransferase n=1 Tax=Oceanispirochaeta crateris TaxID=2518645 RepID=UPI00143D7DE7|nr:GNAT family N-acetyltransferase [Oceanispirochaeta crateris]
MVLIIGDRSVENALADSNHSIFFLYTQNNTIVAFAFGNICAGLESGADYLWMNELYVSPNFRKQNIASEILAFIEKWSKSLNIKYIACITGVNNIPAQDLYKKNGFEIKLTNWVDKSIE